jgi:hypothetical protein
MTGFASFDPAAKKHRSKPKNVYGLEAFGEASDSDASEDSDSLDDFADPKPNTITIGEKEAREYVDKIRREYESKLSHLEQELEESRSEAENFKLSRDVKDSHLKRLIELVNKQRSENQELRSQLDSRVNNNRQPT